jgi:cyclase
MLCKRIIPCLDVKYGRVVKGVAFGNLIDAGDPIECAREYSRRGADELVFLDISATLEGRRTMLEIVSEVGRVVNIPLTVGGGVSSIEDIERLLRAGADKVGINSKGIKNPELITEGARNFGRQCIVGAVDVKWKEESSTWEVYSHGGTIATGLNAINWCMELERLGAGEILLTSIDKDGTKKGFDIALLREITSKISIPVIASGGAGSMLDFYEAFTKGTADAALAASLFHHRIIEINSLKSYLKNKGIPVRIEEN